jgi:hypothetical protein
MSFSINKVKNGRPVCKIRGGQYDGLIVYYLDKKISLESNSKQKYIDFISLKLDEGCEFEPYPDTSTERQVVSCFGPSGCGKSYFCKKYMKNYKQAFPQNDIFLVSPFKEDVSIDDIKGIQKLKLDDNWINEPVVMDDIPSNSLVMIDDLDVYENKAVIKSVETLQGSILRGGRHESISLCITQHVSGSADKETRNLLLESHLIVLYLGSGGNYSRILTHYLGLDNKQIMKLKKLDSRWICFQKAYPGIWFSETELGFTKDI